MKESLLGGLNLEAARVALQAAPVAGAGALTTVPALYLLLDAIEPDPEQPRRFMPEDDSDLENLSESILQHGVIQPITVEARGAGRYQIVAGERRWRAARMALSSGKPCARRGYDLGRIPAVIAQSANSTDRLEMQLVENLARAEMRNEDVAIALQALLDKLQVRPAELARRLGRSESWLRAVLVMGSPEAKAVAAKIGVALDAIGMNEMQRLISWRGDPDKVGILDVLAASIKDGAKFSRSLMNDLEAQAAQGKEQQLLVTPVAAAESTEPRVWNNPAEVGPMPASAGAEGADEGGDDSGIVESCDLVDSYGGVEGADPVVDRGLNLPQSLAPAQTEADSVLFSIPMELVEQIFGLVNVPWTGSPESSRIIEAIQTILSEVKERRAKSVRSATFTIRPDTPDGEL